MSVRRWRALITACALAGGIALTPAAPASAATPTTLSVFSWNIDLATAALQFSLRDPRIDATVVGITSEGRISSLIASAGAHIPDPVWEELEELVPPATTWLDPPST